MPLGKSPGYREQDGRPGKHGDWVRKAGMLNSPPLEDQIAENFGEEYQTLAFFSNKVLLGMEKVVLLL